MKHSALQFHSDDTFKTAFWVSVILHASLLFGFAVKNFILPSGVIEIPPSVRVDVVALPDKMPDEPPPQVEAAPAEKPAPPTPAPTPKVEKKPDPVVLKPKPTTPNLKDSQKKALDKLKALDALEKIKNEVNAKNTPKPAAPARPTFKGNIISSGNSFTGLSRLTVNKYLEGLVGRVREQWVLPQWLSDDNLKAAVVISIDARGQITRKEIYASSGNSVFDASCIAAVTAAAEAAPFEAPPSEVEDALIMIRFPFQ